MLFEKVRALIADQLGVNPDSITLESHLVDDLGVDSLDIVEISMALEEEYGVDEIAEEEMETIKTVGDLVDCLQSKIPE